MVTFAGGDRGAEGAGGISSEQIFGGFLVYLVIDRLKNEVRQESSWTLVFNDDE